MIIIKIGNFRFIEKNWNISCLSNVIKNNLFCTSSEKLFLKDVKINNHWVGPSVVKPVDVESFQINKDIKEGGKEKNYDFYMYTIEESPLEKELNVG